MRLDQMFTKNAQKQLYTHTRVSQTIYSNNKFNGIDFCSCWYFQEHSQGHFYLQNPIAFPSQALQWAMASHAIIFTDGRSHGILWVWSPSNCIHQPNPVSAGHHGGSPGSKRKRRESCFNLLSLWPSQTSSRALCNFHIILLLCAKLDLFSNSLLLSLK